MLHRLTVIGDVTQSTELDVFAGSIIDQSVNKDVFSLKFSEDEVDIVFFCVYDKDTCVLTVQLQSIGSVSSKSKIFSRLAARLLAVFDGMVTKINVVMNKRESTTAAWMRACLYVGFILAPAKRVKSFISTSGVAMLSMDCELEMNNEKKDIRCDASVTTCDDDHYSYPNDSSSMSSSPASVASSSPILSLRDLDNFVLP